jgi:hypothetical protein
MGSVLDVRMAKPQLQASYIVASIGKQMPACVAQLAPPQ